MSKTQQEKKRNNQRIYMSNMCRIQKTSSLIVLKQ